MFNIPTFDEVDREEVVESLPTTLRSMYVAVGVMEDSLHRMTLSMVQTTQAVGLLHRIRTGPTTITKEEITSLRNHAPMLATRVALNTPITFTTEDYRVFTEANITYEIFDFITATIRKIYEAIRDTIKWIVRQFKPSTHYKAMLEKRYKQYFKSNVVVDEEMFNHSVMTIESFDVMTARIQALSIISNRTKDLLTKHHRSIQDDKTFELIAELKPQLEVLEYTVDPNSRRVSASESITEPDAGKLKDDKGWSVTKLKHIIPDVLRLIEDQSLFKQIELKLKQLQKDTAKIEKKLSSKSKLDKNSEEYTRIATTIAYVTFFSTLGKMYSAQVQKIAFKHINLCDKLRLTSNIK